MRQVVARRRAPSTCVALAATALLAACSSGAASSPGATEPSVTPSATPSSSVTDVSTPPPITGTVSMLEVAPQIGTYEEKQVPSSAGEVTFVVTCAGEGAVLVHYEPMAWLTFKCTEHQAMTWSGPIDVGKPHNLRIKVDAQPDVTWAMRVVHS